MREDINELAALLAGCEVADLLSVRLREDGLSVVWGIGWKKVFPLADLPAARLEAQRAQMVESPAIEISPTNDTDGLQTLFPERLVKVLVRAGFASPASIQAATDEELRAVGGIGPRTLKDIRELLPYVQQSIDTIGS